jgi:hypothetical protein
VGWGEIFVIQALLNEGADTDALYSKSSGATAFTAAVESDDMKLI